MHLTNHDFHDLYRLLCFFRAWPDRLPAMCGGVRELLAIVCSPKEGCAGPDALRRCLRPFVGTDDPYLSWVHTGNDVPAQLEPLRKPQAHIVARAILQELLDSAGDRDRVYLLCDSTHNLPLAFTSPGWHHMPLREMIYDYRERYNPDFLTTELKRL